MKRNIERKVQLTTESTEHTEFFLWGSVNGWVMDQWMGGLGGKRVIRE